MDIVNILNEKGVKAAGKPALIFREQPVTWQMLRENTFKLANGLKKLGVRKGDKVVVYLPNCPEYVYSYLAVWSIGAVAVPLDYMLTEDELVSCLSHCEAVCLIARPKPAVSFERIASLSPKLKNVITCQDKLLGALSLESVIAANSDTAPASDHGAGDYAIIFYTSGTTGKPKGVLINYRQLDAPVEGFAFFVDGDIGENDVTLCALPFSHLGGLIYIQGLLKFGSAMVLMERFSPFEFLKNIQYYKANCFWLVPSMYYAILGLKEFESFDLSSLRWVVVFGAPSSPDVIRRFHAHCPKANLYHGWGMTETNAPTVVTPTGFTNIESVGRPAPWVKIKIFDENDRELPPGEIGEIVVSSWVVTDGYFKDEELTRQTLRSGWFHTGDLGKLDEKGFLYIRGRKKEMIKVAGEIVFEPEVEAAIHKNPAVSEAAVVGVQDKLRGEVPKAYIVLKPGEAADPEGMRFFLRQHLAHFKIPHYFEFVASLPKNRTGKIDKEKLRS